MKSESPSDKADYKNTGIVPTDRDHVLEAITSCLEEPLRHLLEKWMHELQTILTKQAVWTASLIEHSLKRMTFEENKNDNTNIVTRKLKEYLYRYIFVDLY